MSSAHTDPPFDAASVAARFVAARRSAAALAAYPGTVPPDLAAAYRCQEEAIGLWDDAIAGWKVGWIAEPMSARFGAQRLVGPIFRRALQRVTGDAVVPAPVFEHGFAAIEAEYVFEIGRNAPAEARAWTPDEARGYARAMHVGVEIASSPLANINDYGPAVVASDFGNNAGLLLGAAVPDWQDRGLDTLRCETRIDGETVGRGGAATVSGGPLAALAFALEITARRGRPLRTGDLVTTGAATGVHDIRVGQAAEVEFQGIATLRCAVRAMTPVA